MRWAHRFDGYDRTVVIHVNDVPDALDCLICVDTHRIAPARLVALARGIEAALVAAALDPAAPTGVPAHSGNTPGAGRPITWPAARD
ncbi:MAG TPA: hypothetical protein VH352_04280, partial [Pseudonocardiaceae bacterium]|nr:hypothetical protein [Pseudonocardiaceae bacterium]